MEYNKKIVKTAVSLINKFRQVKNNNDGIIANQSEFYDGDRNAAADDIISNINTCSEFVCDELYDEAMLFIQALLNAEVAGYFIQDTEVYKTREEYIDADNKAVIDYYSNLNDTLQNLTEEINNEIEKGTD